MRAVVQRVSSASVRTDAGMCGEIGRGLLVLLGVARDDAEEDCVWLAKKIARLRIFPEPADGGIPPEHGSMNRSVTDIDGEVLVVSQFTLHARVNKGTRPSYNDAAPPEAARVLYEEFLLQMQTALGHRVQCGEFGAMMKVSLVNDGPVTIIVDTKRRD